MQVPYVGFREVNDGSGLGYHIGVALDSIILCAIENGCSQDELQDRLEEAIERAVSELRAD